MTTQHVSQGELVLTPTNAKIVRLSAEIRSTPAERPEYLHTVLCQVGLPRRQITGTTFERRNGKASLLITAGKAWDGKNWQQQLVPYGTRPRLALFHISTEAIRLQSRTVPIGRSISAFMRRLNMDTNGRNMTAFRQQMNALCACHMQLGYGIQNMDAKPIQKYDAWTNNGELGKESVIELSEKFWLGLKDAAVPLDSRALEALQHSCLALDIYTWLAHRLRRVSKQNGEIVSWANMREQFGQEYSDDKNFKRTFNAALRQVLEVYPQARLEPLRVRGLKLLPSPAPVSPTTKIIDFGRLK
uniref:IncW-like replication protein n=1 Tax=Acetobacter pasteurianus TaxID=438 RepID=I3W079_ACEPA|nr:replication protein RepA [Acetobacter pasteurianus]AFK89006.1 IncW-like replication protein [Acetobacter pasteurianus]